MAKKQINKKKVNIKLLPGQTYVILDAEQMFQVSTALINLSASIKDEKERLDLLKISEEATKAIAENQYIGDIYDEEENWAQFNYCCDLHGYWSVRGLWSEKKKDDGNKLFYSGGSIAVSPMGEQLANLKNHQEDLKNCRLSNSDLQEIRTQLPFLKDRQFF